MNQQVKYGSGVRQRAAALRSSGLSFRHISNLLGPDPRTLRAWLNEPVAHSPNLRVHPQGLYDAALELLQDGASYTEVRRTTGISVTTLRRTFPGYGMTASDGARLAALHVRLHQDDLLPGKSKYDSPTPRPWCRRLSNQERRKLVA